MKLAKCRTAAGTGGGAIDGDVVIELAGSAFSSLRYHQTDEPAVAMLHWYPTTIGVVDVTLVAIDRQSLAARITYKRSKRLMEGETVLPGMTVYDVIAGVFLRATPTGVGPDNQFVFVVTRLGMFRNRKSPVSCPAKIN